MRTMLINGGRTDLPSKIEVYLKENFSAKELVLLQDKIHKILDEDYSELGTNQANLAKFLRVDFASKFLLSHFDMKTTCKIEAYCELLQDTILKILLEE